MKNKKKLKSKKTTEQHPYCFDIQHILSQIGVELLFTIGVLIAFLSTRISNTLMTYEIDSWFTSPVVFITQLAIVNYFLIQWGFVDKKKWAIVAFIGYWLGIAFLNIELLFNVVYVILMIACIEGISLIGKYETLRGIELSSSKQKVQNIIFWVILIFTGIPRFIGIVSYVTGEVKFTILMELGLIIIPLLFASFVLFLMTPLFKLPFYQLKEYLFTKKLNKQGIQIHCNSCQNAVQPTHVYCPSCKQKHDLPLSPSLYGVHYHSCIHCNYSLSTKLVERIEQKVIACCPKCEEKVPIIASHHQHIALIGGTSLQKIELLNQVKNSINSLPQPVIENDQNQATFGDWNTGQLLYQKTTYIYPTKPYDNRFHFYTINQQDDRNDLLVFKNITSVLFFIDVNKNSKPLDDLRRLIQGLEKYFNPTAIRQIKVNIVLSKTITKTHNNLKEFIKTELKEEAFIHHVKQQFDTVNYGLIGSIILEH